MSPTGIWIGAPLPLDEEVLPEREDEAGESGRGEYRADAHALAWIG